MPNGYRRGGAYTRDGRTYYRRGATIKTRTAVYGSCVAAIVLTTMTGGALVGSPVLIVFGVLGVAGYAVYRNRRRLKPVTRKLERWAGKRMAHRNTRPVLVARVPAKGARRG